jgi:hypothetical protein
MLRSFSPDESLGGGHWPGVIRHIQEFGIGGEPARSWVTIVVVNWSRCSSCWASVGTDGRSLGCKQNLGKPVNDRFKLRAEDEK